MRSPNFFIVGAPKCGTTSLATWLRDHPRVYISSTKEPHYFSERGRQLVPTKKGYDQLFSGVEREHIAIGEGSTSYLYSEIAIPRIVEEYPAAKFIVCLRNPVEMAPSLHSERLSGGLETIRDFKLAWKMDPQRRSGKQVPMAARRQYKYLVYSDQCQLGKQIERLYEYVDRANVLPVLFDDLKDNPRLTYQTVLSFLGVPDDGRDQFSKENASKKVRSMYVAAMAKSLVNLKSRLGVSHSFGIVNKILSRNTVSGARSELDPALREELFNYFSDDVKLLQELINRDLTDWLIRSSR